MARIDRCFLVNSLWRRKSCIFFCFCSTKTTRNAYDFSFPHFHCDFCQHRSKASIIRLYQQSRFMRISHSVCDRFATWHMLMRQICNWQVLIPQWQFELSESILSVKSEILMRDALRPHTVHRQFDDGWVHVAQKRKLFTFSFAPISYQNILNHIRWHTNYATEQWQFNYAIIYLPFDVVKPGWLAEREGGEEERKQESSIIRWIDDEVSTIERHLCHNAIIVSR